MLAVRVGTLLLYIDTCAPQILAGISIFVVPDRYPYTPSNRSDHCFLSLRLTRPKSTAGFAGFDANHNAPARVEWPPSALPE